MSVVQILVASALTLVVAGAVIDLRQRIGIRRRNRILTGNQYFIGHQLCDVISEIGGYSLRYPRSGGQVDYCWGIGDDALLLATGPEGKIIDFCPPRQEPEFVLNYFAQNHDELIGRDLREIERVLGKSHQSGSYDYGLDCDTWNCSNNKVVHIWSRCGICTEITVRDAS